MADRSTELLDEFTGTVQMYGMAVMANTESMQARLRADAHSLLDLYLDDMKQRADAIKAKHKQG